MHDYVLIWNAVALELNRRDHTGRMNALNQRGPTRSSRALAMVHLAMHDAFFGIPGTIPTVPNLPPGLTKNFQTYLPINTTLQAGLTPAAHVGPAVTAAASEVLKALYPDFTQVVEEALNGFDFPPNDPGWAFGDDIAKRILQDRLNDGHDKGGAAPGLQRYWQHREDPTNLGQGFLGERWGEVAWFSAPGLPTQNPHPIPRSNAYNDALDEVRVKGSKLPNSGTPNTSPIQQRTPGETCMGLYWAYDGASQIGTPPRLYNQIIRLIAAQRFNGVVRMAAHARLLALANVAMADAGIAAWYYKYHYQLWRPVLGIREHDDSFHMKGPPNTPDASKPNPTVILHRRCDPFWTPLGAPRTNEVGKLSFTPPFPAYPSGHATFGAAAFEIVRLFLGVPPNSADTISFDLISDEMNGRSLDSDGSFRGRHLRRYPSLLDAMFDNALSRVFLGVHWRFDGLGQNVTNASKILTDNSNIGGVPVGRKIAQDIFNGGMTHAGGSKETLTAWAGALTA